MKSENTQTLAEKIALILQENSKESDEDFLRLNLEKINHRLDKIESRIVPQNPQSQIPNSKSLHPSQEKFLSLEELADEIIGNLQNEKACPYEPTGKLCDNCSMCNSRGF